MAQTRPRPMIGSATCARRPRSFCDCSEVSNNGTQMKYCLALTVLAFLVGSGAVAASDAASSGPMVLLISVDGMKPEAVIDAQSHGLKVPNLRALMADGAYAGAV